MTFREIYNMDFEEANEMANDMYNEEEAIFTDRIQNLYSYGEAIGMVLFISILTLPLLFIMKLMVILHNICNTTIKKIEYITRKYLV